MISTKINMITDNIGMITGHTNIGILLDKKDNFCNIYIVDTGQNADDGKQILDNIDKYAKGEGKLKNYRIYMILNTHAHADHAGGNYYVQSQTQCKIATSSCENAVLNDQRLSVVLVCGTIPVSQMSSDFYQAKKTNADTILYAGQTLLLSTLEICVVDLPGHSLEQIGFLVKDTVANKKVLFLGDAIFGRKNIGRYWIPYIYDIDCFMQTLQKICTIESDYYLPSHGDITTSIDAVSELNMIALLETQDAILHTLQTPRTQEEVIKIICDLNSLDTPLGQYLMIASTLRSFLNCLSNSGKIFVEVHNNLLYYKKAPFSQL